MELPGGGEAAGKEEGRRGDSLVMATDMEPQLCEQLQRVLVDILQRLLANGKTSDIFERKDTQINQINKQVNGQTD